MADSFCQEPASGCSLHAFFCAGKKNSDSRWRLRCLTDRKRIARRAKTIVKSVRDLIEISTTPTPERKGKSGVKMTKQELQRQIEKLEKSMREAARMMEYEYAAVLRDEIIRLRGEANQAK